MKKRSLLFISTIMFVFTFNLVAQKIKSKEVNTLFRKNNIESYRVIVGGFWDDYDFIYLGFNTHKNLILAATLQKIKKTYKIINIIVAIEKKGDDYFVQDVIATNINIIKDATQRKNVQTAIASFKGKKVAPKDKDTVDAVTGATFCHNRVYEDINKIIHITVKTMKKSQSKQ